MNILASEAFLLGRMAFPYAKGGSHAVGTLDGYCAIEAMLAAVGKDATIRASVRLEGRPEVDITNYSEAVRTWPYLNRMAMSGTDFAMPLGTAIYRMSDTGRSSNDIAAFIRYHEELWGITPPLLLDFTPTPSVSALGV